MIDARQIPDEVVEAAALAYRTAPLKRTHLQAMELAIAAGLAAWLGKQYRAWDDVMGTGLYAIRLRAESERQRALFNDMCGTAKRALKDLGKANDEIERMRAALRETVAWADRHGKDPDWLDVARAALAEEKPNDR